MDDKKPLNILIVDDSESDLEIALLAFEAARIKNRIFTLTDSEDVFNFLEGRGTYQDRGAYPRPDLILMDIRMPKEDGISVLKKIKLHPAHQTIPVVMLTSSKHEKDVLESYRHGASTYLQKPVGYHEFVKLTDSFNAYWQSAVLSS